MSKANRRLVGEVIDIRTALNVERTAVDHGNIEEDKVLEFTDMLVDIQALTVELQKKLTAYYDARDAIYTGNIRHIDSSDEIWIGKLDDGRTVMVRPANLGAGEKLVKSSGNIVVHSYGGHVRLPPFIVIS